MFPLNNCPHNQEKKLPVSVEQGGGHCWVEQVKATWSELSSLIGGKSLVCSLGWYGCNARRMGVNMGKNPLCSTTTEGGCATYCSLCWVPGSGRCETHTCAESLNVL